MGRGVRRVARRPGFARRREGRARASFAGRIPPRRFGGAHLTRRTEQQEHRASRQSASTVLNTSGQPDRCGDSRNAVSEQVPLRPHAEVHVYGSSVKRG